MSWFQSHHMSRFQSIVPLLRSMFKSYLKLRFQSIVPLFRSMFISYLMSRIQCVVPLLRSLFMSYLMSRIQLVYCATSQVHVYVTSYVKDCTTSQVYVYVLSYVKVLVCCATSQVHVYVLSYVKEFSLLCHFTGPCLSLILCLMSQVHISFFYISERVFFFLQVLHLVLFYNLFQVKN